MTLVLPEPAFRQRYRRRLLAWYERHGRHDLPWQQPRSAYRVWVSEIMLQQTQVATVIPYFQRFMASFPDIRSLATASPDAVLGHWSGLGYYARARNLHAAARTLLADFDGELPRERQLLEALPGIGRSTAAAICAQAFDMPEPILDGNVKRVLARLFALRKWPGQPAVQRQLWLLAEALMPRKQAAAYTQASMDLGATVCRRSRPACAACPVQPLCQANAQGIAAQLPARKPAKAKPVRQTLMLLIEDSSGRVLLERRPAAGLWGGLWSLPMVDNEVDIEPCCQRLTGCPPSAVQPMPGFRHSFTHYHLDIQPQRLRLAAVKSVSEPVGLHWLDPLSSPPGGMAAPVSRLLEDLSLADQGAISGY